MAMALFNGQCVLLQCPESLIMFPPGTDGKAQKAERRSFLNI